MAYTTIDDPAQYFNTVLYTGNGSDDRSISGVGFQPNFLWVKERSATSGHIIVDSIRGATKFIQSHNNTAEDTNADIIQAFESDGFQIGTHQAINENSETYVAWNWKEDTTAGFDIVTYTGASGDQTFAHSLGVAPEWYLVKERGNVNSWVVNHIGLANQTNAYLLLNTNDAAGTDSWFNSTAPSSSVVHANDGDSPTNRNGGTYVMYLWRSVKGFSKFGSFTGNANTDGPFVYTGFRPAWVLIKNSSANGENWNLFDNKRNGFNGSGEALRPNTSEAEYDRNVDFLANGFKVRDSSGEVSGNGNTLIYMAFAESPFVNSNGVPCNAG
tara:strand:- start:225 stop:1208 length:984 start_codon:yes stop_codon:yes gene_type:complete